MTGRVANRFRILLAHKATKEQYCIAINDVQRETGIAWSTLDSCGTHQLTRNDAPMIKALCDYFECQVGIYLFSKQIARFNGLIFH